jgi:hypothetical protein
MLFCGKPLAQDPLPYGPVAAGGFVEERRELLGAVDQPSLCQKWHILARASCFRKRRDRRFTGGIEHSRRRFVRLGFKVLKRFIFWDYPRASGRGGGPDRPNILRVARNPAEGRGCVPLSFYR